MFNNTMISIVYVLLLTLSAIAGCTPGDKPVKETNLLFPDRHGWDLKGITLSDAAHNILDFKRVNCVWVIGNENKPSNESRVSDLSETLVSLASTNLVTQDSAEHKKLKVGDSSYSRKVVLTFKDGNSLTLLIGSPTVTKQTYVRLADKNEVFSVDEPLLKKIDLDINSWVDPEAEKSLEAAANESD